MYKPFVVPPTGFSSLECADCYFPLRQGNHVTLFSCARNADVAHSLPLPDGSGHLMNYSPPSLWIDLYRAIVACERFIYITGWSVFPRIKLLRSV